eukprot:CAMPEP_0197664878 /NCGR_PEP_ID=MMETSP1338-20131121/58901_1 /TAXON_ID=43686 ORGANISM="Pelagodinium beii, Strain RCC1491" /NCGR_SAMPLE_ID=MMETSP1338 /ASSEMBLY_ACC=CAM_ASM_000754 /LENGTH=687 /DNA_ID=CAMNT_0043243603 /DNA_START=82 /DNA_END=2145 /DNA_ORIENTATION=+
MARLLQALHLITVCAVAREQAASSVTPVGKAISMLKGMKRKGLNEMNEEEMKVVKFKSWCKETEETKKGEIEDGEVKIEQLKALILRADALADRLQSGIDRLNKKVGKWKSEEEKNAKAREEAETEYKASSKELKRSSEALERAIAVIQEQAEAAQAAEAKKAAEAEEAEKAEPEKTSFLEEANAESFLQVQSDLQDADQSEAADALLEVQRDSATSPGVMDMLKKLKNGASDQLRTVNMDEEKAKQAHRLLMDGLKTQIETGESELKENKVDQAKALQEKKEAQLDLSETRGDIEEDMKYLQDMKALCSTKADDFAQRKAIREKELKAISTAIGILTEKVGLVQVAKEGFEVAQERVASALARLRSRSQRSDRLQASLVQFLKQRSSSLNSVTLSVLSERVAADPLKNVKKMITDMIETLRQEVRETEEKKKFCDAELKDNQATRTKKSEKSEDLQLEIEDAASQVIELGDDIEELKKAIVELGENVGEATKQRQEDQAKNLQQIQENAQAQAACDEAIVALREFYGKAAEGSLLQESSASFSEGPADDAPETFDAKYTGMGQSGVIDILEVATTQYASLRAEAEDAERKEADEFQTLVFEAKKDEALKKNEIGHKQERRSRKELAGKQAKIELEETQGQLEKANKYFEELKEQCLKPPMSHEERVKQRQAEIDSMKEALKILEGQ